MTAQIGDKISYIGQEYVLASEPLSPYLYSNKIEKLFIGFNSACYRGYYATWKIENKSLYLMDIESPASLKNEDADKMEEQRSAMNTLFPGQTKIFADWVNGKLKIQSGKILKYVPMGYESVYESDLFLTFENGILVNEKVVINTPTE
ncbi:MAG: hypothetical protein P4L34_10395 [Paludibacter sp.]|nr:hypothetical protein [Paludibacter sp.]